MWVWCSRAAARASRWNRSSRVASLQPVERERLQGHVPAQGFLDRLVHHPHAAGADGTEHQVIAQRLRHRGLRARLARLGRRLPRLAEPSSSMTSMAGNSARIRSAISGYFAVYSLSDGRSPWRYRSRNSSTNSSTGSNVEDRLAHGTQSFQADRPVAQDPA